MLCFSVTAKTCDVDNGGCEHFCVVMASGGTGCQCASGYRLKEDGFMCEPIGDLIRLLLKFLIVRKTSNRATFSS